MAKHADAYLTFDINPEYPEQTLERCAHQLDFVHDMVAAAGGLDLSDTAICGLCHLRAAVSLAMQEVQEMVHARRARVA